MKKLSLIIVSLLLTVFSYAQDFSRVIKATKLEWKDDKWVVINTQYLTDMFIIIKDWDIKIGPYKLKTYGDPKKVIYDTHITYSWKCIDYDGNKCIFMIKKFKPEITTHILYAIVYGQASLMYEYECE
jgi:hypothetical protein